MDTWLNAEQAAEHANRARAVLTAGHPQADRVATVTVRTVRSWVARGHLQAEGLDADGRQLFRLRAVARAELATRQRALRMVGISITPTPRPENPYPGAV